jgi:hypothetical protein
MYRQVLMVCLLGLATILGCSGGDPHNRQAVSGTVSINGKMIPYGNIEFSPMEQQKTNLILDIRDGKFSAEKSKGISPGKYTIRIQGMDSAPPPTGDTPGTSTGPQPKSIVPVKFGAESKEEVTIKAGEKNELKIDLKN